MKESPRRLAVEILNRVEQDNSFAEPLIDSCLELRDLAGSDRGLLTMLVYGTLRMRGCLDWIAGGFYRGNFAKMETGLLNILRTALYQVFLMDRVPAFAAVNEAVEIAKSMFPGRERLVNAILRKSVKCRDEIAYPDFKKDPALFISVFHSHPLWLVKKFISVYGLEETVKLCSSNNEMPPVTLRVNRLKSDRSQAIKEFSGAGLKATVTDYSPDGVNIDSGDIRNLQLYKDGSVIFQDEASQLISIVAASQMGEGESKDVLDLCAGSGVKTTHLAEILNNKGRILAVDLKRGKLKALGRLAGRHGISIVECRAADATSDLGREYHGKFDLALIDAPCSGTGTLRRNPEIKWRLTPAEVERLSRLQNQIINTSPAYLKPGGAVFYCTCSILPDENETVIKKFCSEFPQFELERPHSESEEVIDNNGYFRTGPQLIRLPAVDEADPKATPKYAPANKMDGFFGALLRKKS